MAEAEVTKKPITDEIATAQKDIDVFAGWLARLENPDPVLRSEAGGKGLKLYDEVGRDPHASAVLQSRYLAIAGCEWDVEPAGEDDRAKGIAEFVTGCLKALNWTQAVQELMKGVLYGFYVSEIMWAVKNGQWKPAKLIGKHPRRFSFGLDRQLKLLTPANMIEGEPVPDRKFVRFTYGSSDNPYGEGLGQKIWWPVWFKKHGIKYWLIFLEKFGMPTGVGKYPPGTDPKDQAKLLDAIEAIQNETGITIPENMMIELLEATRAGNVTYETLCEYMDRQISKAVLGQTATTEGTPGKLGNEDAQQEVRQEIKAADADLLAEALNETLVRWIVDYNFAGVTDYPSVWIRTEHEKDLKPLAERDEILVKNIGVKVPVRYFRDTYGLPEAEGDEETVGGTAGNDASMTPFGGVDPRASESAARLRFSPGIIPAERLGFAEKGLFPDQRAIDGAAAPGNEIMEPILKPIMDLIRQGNSYEAVEDALLDRYPDMDAGELEKMIERAIFASEMWGRLNA
jgi:phage gp29-like protein